MKNEERSITKGAGEGGKRERRGREEEEWRGRGGAGVKRSDEGGEGIEGMENGR